jgi:hypothetical protein
LALGRRMRFLAKVTRVRLAVIIAGIVVPITHLS